MKPTSGKSREAGTRRITKSALIRESLEAALGKRVSGKNATCYDLARDLAGSVQGLPADLAHNPEYMIGFGH